MTFLYVILGGAAGGVLGWLFDKAAARRRPEADEECATTA